MGIGTSENGLSLITVKKPELLEVLKKNRDAHRAFFLEAQDGYRVAVIAELDTMLKDAREGKRFAKQIMLPTPEDHTRDYDRVILMLEMSIKDVVEIDEREFARYVLDDWAWKHEFIETSNRYTNRRA